GIAVQIAPGITLDMQGAVAEKGVEMEMGFAGDLFDHAGDFAGAIVPDLDGFSEGGFVTEIFGGECLGDHDAAWLDERGMDITLYKRKGEELGEVRVDKDRLLL